MRLRLYCVRHRACIRLPLPSGHSGTMPPSPLIAVWAGLKGQALLVDAVSDAISGRSLIVKQKAPSSVCSFGQPRVPPRRSAAPRPALHFAKLAHLTSHAGSKDESSLIQVIEIGANDGEQSPEMHLRYAARSGGDPPAASWSSRAGESRAPPPARRSLPAADRHTQLSWISCVISKGAAEREAVLKSTTKDPVSSARTRSITPTRGMPRSSPFCASTSGTSSIVSTASGRGSSAGSCSR